MRVYFISSGLQGCFAVRCLLPLAANGWDGDQTSLNLDTKTPENKTIAARASDVVVFHRPDDPRKLELARLLKANGKKIVYDNDDTFKDDGGVKLNEYMDAERLRTGLERINKTLDAFISEADLVTCSTEFLAEEYRKLNPNVIVLPNCVDPFYFDEPLKNETNVMRVGIVGSIGITSDMDVLKPIIEHFKDDKRIKFVLFSLPPDKKHKLYTEEFKFWEGLDVEWQPFVDMQEYYDVLNNLRLDLMIIPRADNYFNRCKSNLKFLEASMFEIPVIAQSFPDGKSPYQVNSQDAEHMVLATDAENFISKIEYMINYPKFRIEMGQKAKEYVLANYNIENNGVKWLEAYKTMYDKPSKSTE